MQVGHVGHQEQHREPEQGTAHVPDRHIEVLHPAIQQRQYERHTNKRAADDEEDVDLPGNLKPLQAVAHTHSDRSETRDQGRVPQRRTEKGKRRADQWCLQQPRNHEECDAEARHRRPAVGHCIQVNGANASEGQPGLMREPIGFVQPDGCREASRRCHQQPGECTTEEEEHQGSRGGVGAGAIDQFGVAHGRRHTGGRVFTGADLARRKDHLGRPGTLVEHAAALRPDEDQQGRDRKCEGRQQDGDGAHGVLRRRRSESSEASWGEFTRPVRWSAADPGQSRHVMAGLSDFGGFDGLMGALPGAWTLPQRWQRLCRTPCMRVRPPVSACQFVLQSRHPAPYPG